MNFLKRQLLRLLPLNQIDLVAADATDKIFFKPRYNDPLFEAYERGERKTLWAPKEEVEQWLRARPHTLTYGMTFYDYAPTAKPYARIRFFHAEDLVMFKLTFL